LRDRKIEGIESITKEKEKQERRHEYNNATI